MGVYIRVVSARPTRVWYTVTDESTFYEAHAVDLSHVA